MPFHVHFSTAAASRRAFDIVLERVLIGPPLKRRAARFLEIRAFRFFVRVEFWSVWVCVLESASPSLFRGVGGEKRCNLPAKAGLSTISQTGCSHESS